ncbi:MAG: hypothetical protein V4820_03450 [Pseudomonadota bacterium]
MIIVVAWALLIWLVVLLAFGPDMFKLTRGEGGPEGEDQSRAPTGGATRDRAAR